MDERNWWLMDHDDVDAATNAVSGDVKEAIFEVRRILGPGMLERPYKEALVIELRLKGHQVEREVPVAIDYKGHRIERAYFIDLLVDDKVIVEAKATDAIAPEHVAQIWTQLRWSRKEVGLLVNFNGRSGQMIRRLANKQGPSAALAADAALP